MRKCCQIYTSLTIFRLEPHTLLTFGALAIHGMKNKHHPILVKAEETAASQVSLQIPNYK